MRRHLTFAFVNAVLCVGLAAIGWAMVEDGGTVLLFPLVGALVCAVLFPYHLIRAAIAAVAAREGSD